MATDPHDDDVGNRLFRTNLCDRLHQAVTDVCREMNIENDPIVMAGLVAASLGAACIRRGTEPEWLHAKIDWLVQESNAAAAARSGAHAPALGLDDAVPALVASPPLKKPCGCPDVSSVDLYDSIRLVVFSNGVTPKTLSPKNLRKSGDKALRLLGVCDAHRPDMVETLVRTAHNPPPPRVEEMVRTLTPPPTPRKSCGCPLMCQDDILDAIRLSFASNGSTRRPVTVESLVSHAGLTLQRLGYCDDARPAMLAALRGYCAMQAAIRNPTRDE